MMTAMMMKKMTKTKTNSDDNDGDDQKDMMMNNDYRYSSPPKALRTLFSGFLGRLPDSFHASQTASLLFFF